MAWLHFLGPIDQVPNGGFWPFFTVNEGLNGAESDFRFVLESGRSECTYSDRALRLLMAESGRSRGSILPSAILR